MKRLLLVGLTSLLVITTSGARGHHLDDPPILETSPMPKNTHVAYTLDVPAGGDWQIKIKVDEIQARMVGLGMFERGPGFGGWLVGVQWTNEHRIHAETEASGTLLDSGDPFFNRNDFTDEISTGGFDSEAGIYEVVLMLGVDGSFDGSLEVRGSPGVAIVGRSHGAALLMHDEQFNGAAHVRVSERVIDVPFVGCLGCATVQATAGVAHQLSAAHSLYGWFRGGEGIQGYEGPPGSSGDDVLVDEPAGDYRFHIDASAGDEPTWLLAADVAPS